MNVNQSLRLHGVSLRGGIPVLVAPAAGAGVVFTTRAGGSSPPPFDSLNLSASTGDRATNVGRNRESVSHALGIAPAWAMARQVHGSRVLVAASPTGDPASGRPVPERPVPEADAIVTGQPGTPVAVLVADCVPIALVGAGVVAAVHAGWRGLTQGVIAAGADGARAAGGEGATALEGWIGPCIGPCCYEVGVEVPQAFAARYPEAPDCTVSVGTSLRFDLRAAAAAALESAGVRVAGSLDVPCTSCDPRFFSHRRDAARHGTTGRQGLIAWLSDSPVVVA